MLTRLLVNGASWCTFLLVSQKDKNPLSIITTFVCVFLFLEVAVQIIVEYGVLMINLKKNIAEIKSFRHKAVLKRDIMINRLKKNVDNKEKKTDVDNEMK